MTDGFLLTLGLSRRAGFLLRGRTEVADGIKNGEIKEFFVSSDISQNSFKEIEKLGFFISLPYTKEELGRAAGVKPMAVFGIKNSGMNDLLKSKLSQNKEA